MAYENKEYNFTIKQFILLNSTEYPEIIIFPLSDSYLQIGEIDNAIKYLQEVNNKKLENSPIEQAKLLNMLGIAYLQNNNLKKHDFII